jgi:hypothetical protein
VLDADREPQSSSTAEAFVKTLKRDYVRLSVGRMP